MEYVLKTKLNNQADRVISKPFFQKNGDRMPYHEKRVRFFQAESNKTEAPVAAGGVLADQSINLQEVPFVPGRELKSTRFQDDPILVLVMRSLLTLKKGKRGVQIDVAVTKIQRALIDAGFPLSEFGPDGIYGSETESAVKQFQNSKNLSKDEQDGKVGPVTLGLLDQHFEDRTKPGLIPAGKGNSTLIFFPVEPLNPRYSDPEPFVEIRDDALRLNGPSFTFLACVMTTGNDTKEEKKWETGHIQDVIDAEIFGEYTDLHKQAFQVSLPIRDAIPEKQLFPWYHSPFIRSVEIGQPVCTPHIDDPGAQFPAIDGNALLQLIQMRFKAIDWFVVRNRNTGEIIFLHHAKWGFDFHVIFDPVKIPEMVSETDEGLIITPHSVLPEPVGKLDPIENGPGRGAARPSMTEGFFNRDARLIKG